MSTATHEAVWLRKLLKDTGASQKQATYNQGALGIAKTLYTV